MNTIFRNIALSATGAFIATSAALGAAPAHAAPVTDAPAKIVTAKVSISHSLVVTNSGSRTIKVCHSWGTDTPNHTKAS